MSSLFICLISKYKSLKGVQHYERPANAVREQFTSTSTSSGAVHMDKSDASKENNAHQIHNRGAYSPSDYLAADRTNICALLSHLSLAERPSGWDTAARSFWKFQAMGGVSVEV